MKREDLNPLDVFVISNPLPFQDDHPNLLLFSILDHLTNTAMMPTNVKGKLHRKGATVSGQEAAAFIADIQNHLPGCVRYRPWKRKAVEFNSCFYRPGGWEHLFLASVGKTS